MNNSRWNVALALFVMFLGATRGVAAQDAAEDEARQRRFGRAGQWALANDSALAVQRSSQADTDGSVTTVTLTPAADYFVIRNLSIGGFLGIQYTKAGDSDGLRFQIGPRVGYNIYLADRWTLWPKVGISYARTNFETQTDDEGDAVIIRRTTQNALALNLFAPVVFHPVAHFFLGFGPFLDTDLNGDNRATVVGGKLTMGGWLGGS